MTIEYPYLPEGKSFEYVAEDHHWMVIAKEWARTQSLDKVMPAAAVMVSKGERLMGVGANGSDFHENNTCRRVELGCKSGEGYDLCEGCHPKNHCEPTVINDTKNNGWPTEGATLYMWGHWWCCQSCWDAMLEAGIETVCLLEGSEVLFNKEHPDNIVGRQFED